MAGLAAGYFYASLNRPLMRALLVAAVFAPLAALAQPSPNPEANDAFFEEGYRLDTLCADPAHDPGVLAAQEGIGSWRYRVGG